MMIIFVPESNNWKEYLPKVPFAVIGRFMPKPSNIWKHGMILPWARIGKVPMT